LYYEEMLKSAKLSHRLMTQEGFDMLYEEVDRELTALEAVELKKLLNGLRKLGLLEGERVLAYLRRVSEETGISLEELLSPSKLDRKGIITAEEAYCRIMSMIKNMSPGERLKLSLMLRLTL